MKTSPSTRNPILWGAYLACSWTWCIGMFLPALLLRDMGWPGFLIFAIPNVLGAAAMGWVIRSRAQSLQFVAKHPDAIWVFSAITLAFHAFWILWIINFIQVALQIPTSFLAGGLGVVGAFFALSFFRRKRAPKLAVALFVFSLSVLIATFCIPDATNSAVPAAAPKSLAPLWMLPVMLFGFLLCPYLDATFHHARQQLDTQKNGRLGFTLGFVGFFSFMILLTTRYAGVLQGALDGGDFIAITSPWLATAILVHILCQWVFTVQTHLDRIRTLPGARKKLPILWALILLAAGAGLLAPRLPSYAGLTGGEMIYRLFMSAYGLVFPAYVLYRVITQKKIVTLWTAIILASPMFWMGFIERQAAWLIPGMIIILLGAIPNITKPTGREK